MYQVARAVSVPLVGIGGIATIDDVMEFLVAGATAVQIGTANFVDPLIWPKLSAGIGDYLARHRISRITDLVGTVATQHEVTQ